MNDILTESKVFKLPGPTNAKKPSIEAFAEKAAQMLGYLPAGDLEGAVAKVGGRVHSRWLSLREACSGWVFPEEIPNLATEHHSGVVLVKGPQDFDIFLSPYTGILRDRFTIAHELGHYFLHSRQGEIPLAAARLNSDLAEWEANWFASAFLMSAKRFREVWDKYKGNQQLGAAVFRVSPAAYAVRAKSLGYLPADG